MIKEFILFQILICVIIYNCANLHIMYANVDQNLLIISCNIKNEIKKNKRA